MSYKIVQTKVNGKTNFTVVPNTWENDNHIRWPNRIKNSVFMKMLRNPFSLPGENWNYIKCRVTRSNIKTLEEGEFEVRKMVGESDTSSSDDAPQSNKQKTETSTLISRIPEINFADLENQLTQQRSQILQQHQLKVEQQQYPQQQNDLKYIDIVQHNHQTVMSAITLLSETVAQINQKLDNIVTALALKTHPDGTVTLATTTASTNNEEDEAICFEVIKTVEELSTFEEKLKKKDFVHLTLKNFEKKCGKRNARTGIDVCYWLVDEMFERVLFTFVTWLGGSRETGVTKTAFKSFQRTINLFTRISQMADASIGEAEVIDFFKHKVIDTSKRRAQVVKTKKRESRKKHRKHITKAISIEKIDNFTLKKVFAKEETNKNERSIAEANTSQFRSQLHANVGAKLNPTSNTKAINTNIELTTIPFDIADSLPNSLLDPFDEHTDNEDDMEESEEETVIIPISRLKCQRNHQI